MKARAQRKLLAAVMLAGGMFAASRSVCAEDARAVLLTVDRAVDMALAASEQLQIQQNDVEKRRQQQRQVKAAVYPRVDAALAWQKNIEYPPATRAALNDYTLGAGVNATQLLWSCGRVAAAIALADTLTDIGRWETDARRQEVIYTAKARFYSALLAQRTLLIARASLENVRRNKILMEQRAAGGRNAKHDLIKMDADLASRLPYVSQAEAIFETAMRALAALIGVEADMRIELQDSAAVDYPPLDLSKAREAFSRNEPNVQAARRAIAAAEHIVQVQRAGYFPTVTAFAAWDYQGTSDEQFVGASHLDSYGVAGVKVTVPLWTGGALAAGLQQAKIDVRNAQLQWRRADKDLRVALDTAVAEYRQYRDTLAANEQAVRLAQEAFAMSQDLFASGQISLTDVNDAEQLLTLESVRRETTVFNVHLTVARIEQLTGERSGGKP
ncbi:MAG: TolC family protein [Candidatus Omnitrophica bacterium]|nr:TolC family protein [Candidatus Omnitrophota bacterium]